MLTGKRNKKQSLRASSPKKKAALVAAFQNPGLLRRLQRE
jgi:hypothetical protein